MATLIKRRQADGSMSYRVQDRTTGYPSLSKTFPTLKSAREFLRKVEVERQEGLAGLKRGRQRLVDAVSDYTQTADYRTRKAGSHTTTHLKWWSDSIGNLPLSSITPELVADHLHRLEAGSLSGSTVNRYRSALSGLFRYAIQVRHWTDHNPCRMVERRKEGNPRERVLTPKEWQALLDAAYAAKAATKENPRTDRIYSPLAQIANMLRLIRHCSKTGRYLRFALGVCEPGG